MISIQRLNARGANKNGDMVVDYLLATEYYRNSYGVAEETTRWGGKLADDPDLDLLGKAVSKEAMLQLAKGFSPTGKPLCRNAGEQPHDVIKYGRDGKPKLDKSGEPITKLEGGHRVGFDLTFSAPKPFSMAFAIAEGKERDAILDAHRRAVAVSMDYLESKVETRRGKAGVDVIATKGLIYMQADHLSSRNLDMNLHTHTLVFGVSKGEQDDKWGTFDAQELYRHRVAADAVYKNELAMNMRELGFGIEQERQLNANGLETGRVLYKVNGISDELCEKFSSRRQEILEYQAEHGVDAQTACLVTRRHKDEPSYAEMSAMWKRTMESMPEGAVPSIKELKEKGDVLMKPCTDEQILEKLHLNEAVVCDHNLVDVIGQENAGVLRFDALMAKIESFKQTMGLVEIEGERIADEDKGASLSRRQTETRYSAPWMVEWEKEVVHRVESRKEEDQQVPENLVEASMQSYEKRKGFTLSDEQRNGVKVVTGPGGVSILEGFAGTGKTTVSDCYSEAFRAQGRNMLGVCVSNAAAQKLEQESGMPCISVSKMIGRLDKGKMTLGPNDVLVIDEAGMIDTNQTRQLLAHAQKGLAKVVVQGDELQLQPIGAGSGMSLAKTAVDSAKLTEVRRQKHEKDREKALLFYNRDEEGNFVDLKKGTRSRRETLQMGTAIMQAMDADGCLDDYDTQTQAIEALVDDYLKSPVAVHEKLVLGHARVEVSALNEGIRSGLKAQGLLAKEDLVVRTNDNGEWVNLPLTKGDRVRFTDTNTDLDRLGVVNNTQGILMKCQENKETGGVDLTVRIESALEKNNSKLITFNTNDFCGIAHNFATTIHKAQGAGKQQVFHLINTGMMDNHSALVAFTRLTSVDYRAYGTVEDIEMLKERFGLERLKNTAMDAGVKVTNEAQAVLEVQSRRAEHEALKSEKSALTDEERAQVAQAAKNFGQRHGAQQTHVQKQQHKHAAAHGVEL